jgi:hypothetical protein
MSVWYRFPQPKPKPAQNQKADGMIRQQPDDGLFQHGRKKTWRQ